MDSGSFARAARRLGRPPSTVSRQVARLEERLGSRLLERTTRTIRLTETGRRYYERGARALEEIADAEREIAELRSTPRGRVRIAAPMEHSVTMSLVSRFLQKYPDVRAELFLTNRFVDLVEDGYDVSIQPGALPDSAHVVAFKLVESPFRIVASPEYLARRGVPHSIQELEEHDCVVFGTSNETDWVLSESTVSVSGRLAVNHLLSVRRAVLEGFGIGLMPAVSCQRDLDTGTLQEVLPGTSPPPVPVWVTYARGRHMAPAVRAFVDFAKETFRPTLEGG